MSKRILLIDSDESFAQGLSNAINARGFVATTATNSEQGMTLAKTESPDLIVVCVEAQPTNGYMLCTRLKKDEQLKSIPVILTSANATPDSFEKHKKLKTRAEDYLIKPFAPSIMLEKAASLMGVQLPDEQHEEIVTSIEDEPLGLGDLVQGEDEPISLSEQDAAAAHSASPEEAVVVEEVEEVVSIDESQPASEGGGDDDLKMFDQAFDSLSPAGGVAQTDEEKEFGQLRLAPEPPAEEQVEVVEEAPAQPTELSAPDDDAVLHGLMNEGETAPANETAAAPVDDGRVTELENRIAELEQRLAERDAELEQAKKGSVSSADLVKAREAKSKADKEVLKLKDELNAKEKELVEIQEQQTALEAQAQQLKDDAVKREGAAKALQQRADALAAAAKKFERELGQAREELKQAAGAKGKAAELDKLKSEHHELRKKHDEHKSRAEQLGTELAGVREMHAEELENAKAEVGKIQLELSTAAEELRKAQDELSQTKDEHGTVRTELEGVRAELEAVRTDLTALTGEKDLLSEERDQLRKQVEEAQAAAQQNEERAVKAYQQIKEGEKLREKARQALQIALRLLEENASADDAEAALDKAS